MQSRGRVGRAGVGGYLRQMVASVGGFIVLIWIIWLINAAVLGDALFAFGIRPRDAAGLIGIPLHPLVHGDLTHVVHNTFGILLFGTLLYLREARDFWIVTALGALLGGFGVWLLGRPFIHIGASTVIFAYFGYLLLAGIFERRIGSLLLSTVLFFGWGSVLLGVLPLQNGISWEGHLFGFIAGVVAARMLARRRPVRSASVAGAALLLILAACSSTAGDSDSLAASIADPQDAFWNEIATLCSQAFAGRLTQGGPSDSVLATSDLRMHVRSCSSSEVRIPFHVGDDRSRTWVLTRTNDGLRLKHDHRHEDGSEDSITQYGGDTRGPGTAQRQEFYADSLTAALIPAARTNVWTIEIVPDSMLAYALRREGTDRRVRAEFDLRRPVDAPPAPWGAVP